MEYLKIKDFAEVITGGTPSTEKNEYWENGTVPWIQSGSCKDDVVDNPDKYITELGLKNSSAKLMPKDTVVIALTGATTGKVGLLNIETSANQSVTGILPNDKCLPPYLFYYLISIREKILSDCYGGAQKHISQGYVKDLEIPIPDIDSQKKFIKKISGLVNLIKIRKNQIASLTELVKSQFVEMFGNIEKRVLLNNCCSKVTDYVASGSFASIKENVKYYDTKEYAIMVKTADFANDFSKNLTYTDKHGYDFLHNSNLFGGELLLSNIGASIGKVHRVPFIDYPMTLAPNTIMLKSNDNYNDTYLQYYFVSEFGQTQLKSLTTATAMPKFNKTQLKELLIIDPPLGLQNKFAKFVEQVDKQKFEFEKQLKKLEELQASLMQEYFG